MVFKLTDEIREAIRKSGGEPLKFEGEKNEPAYVLLSEEEYLNLQGQLPEATDELRAEIQKGIDSGPGIPAADVFRCLRARYDAREYSSN